MMLRLGIVASFLLLTLGSWVLIKPPSDGPAAGLGRLANGALVSDAEQVTRDLVEQPEFPNLPVGAEDVVAINATIASILSGIGIVENEGAAEADDLAVLVIDALRDGLADPEINARVNAAFESGAITVPSALLTTQGSVDTDALLTSVLTRAKARLGTEAPNLGHEVTMHQVAEGDSLAGISIYVFGDIRSFPRLIEANSDILTTPAHLAAGQRLVIPAN